MTQRVFENIIEQCIANKNEKFVYENLLKVIKTRNPYFICDFAERVPLCDNPIMMKMLENAIIEIGDIYHVYEFAYCMTASKKKHFNLKPFEELIINSKDAKLMFYFLECVEECDARRMTKAFLQIADPKWMGPYIENEEVEKFNTEEDLEQIKQQAERSKNSFVPQALKKYFNQHLTLKEIEDEVIAGKNPYEITELAEYFPECDQDKLFEAIIATDDILHIYEYYCCVPTLTTNQKDIIENKVNNDPRAVKMRYYLVAYTDADDYKAMHILNNLSGSGRRKYYNLSLENMHGVRKFNVPYVQTLDTSDLENDI